MDEYTKTLIESIKMSDFTKAEIERINQLYGNDFEGITPDDAMLIGRVEALKATNEDAHKAYLKAIEEESEQRRRQAKEEHDMAMANLETLAKTARERLKAVKDEQQEQA